MFNKLIICQFHKFVEYFKLVNSNVLVMGLLQTILLHIIMNKTIH
jgi:hypothetical protein